MHYKAYQYHTRMKYAYQYSIPNQRQNATEPYIAFQGRIEQMQWIFIYFYADTCACHEFPSVKMLLLY